MTDGFDVAFQRRNESEAKMTKSERNIPNLSSVSDQPTQSRSGVEPGSSSSPQISFSSFSFGDKRFSVEPSLILVIKTFLLEANAGFWVGKGFVTERKNVPINFFCRDSSFNFLGWAGMASSNVTMILHRDRE